MHIWHFPSNVSPANEFENFEITWIQLKTKFKRMAENTEQFLILVNGLASGDVYKYDVILFADDQTENRYIILHESYAAFNHTQVKFDNDHMNET